MRISRPGRLSDIPYGLMRVVLGALFACHGAQKLFGVLGGQVVTGTQLRVAAVIELAGGILIALGLLTRLAAVLASGEMAFAYFLKHAPSGFWPIQNKGELAVVYCFVFLFVATYGAGRYGLDRQSQRGWRG
jgi:putative oxidoreductase